MSKQKVKGVTVTKNCHFNEAWLMKGFDFDNFVKLLKMVRLKWIFELVHIRRWQSS